MAEAQDRAAVTRSDDQDTLSPRQAQGLTSVSSLTPSARVDDHAAITEAYRSPAVWRWHGHDIYLSRSKPRRNTDPRPLGLRWICVAFRDRLFSTDPQRPTHAILETGCQVLRLGE